MAIDRTVTEFLSGSVLLFGSGFYRYFQFDPHREGGKGSFSVACENRVLRQVFLFLGLFCFKGVGAQFSSLRKKDKGLLNLISSVIMASSGNVALRSEVDETMWKITYR